MHYLILGLLLLPLPSPLPSLLSSLLLHLVPPLLLCFFICKPSPLPSLLASLIFCFDSIFALIISQLCTAYIKINQNKVCLLIVLLTDTMRAVVCARVVRLEVFPHTIQCALTSKRDVGWKDGKEKDVGMDHAAPRLW